MTDPGYAPPVTPPGVDEPVDEPKPKPKRPIYPRLLRLRHVEPNAWQRAVLGEGALLVALLLVATDLGSLWLLLVLPLAVAAVVKAHDLLAGALDRSEGAAPPE